MPSLVSDSESQADCALKPGSAIRSRRGGVSFLRPILQWTRRAHLYSGLFMFPWVMLYGITALLFNHPGAFPDREQRKLARSDFIGTALEQMADPAADAELVVAALNAKLSVTSMNGHSLRLVNPDKAFYTRDVVMARARGAGQEHAVILDLPSGTASVSTTQQEDGLLAPFETRGLKVPGSLSERVKVGLPEALTQLGLSADDAGISVGSNLSFMLQADGQLWRANYNVQTGAVTGLPAAAPTSMSVRQFLIQLHVSHGYPSQSLVRWYWAIAVDAMFLSMVFWGLSGLLMWWQIKAVRFSGALVLLSSLVVATILAIGMHSTLGG